MSAARICIVAPEFIGPFPNGGVGTACYWEAFALGQAGCDVTVLYTGPTERETPEHWETHFVTNAPFRYVDVTRAVPAEETDRIARYDHACAEARAAEMVLAWLRGQRFDLVLFQEFLGHGARALQARRSGHALAGMRAATTMHSCRQWIYEGMKRLPGGPGDLAVDHLEKESARLADAVIAPSHHMAGWAASRWRLETGAVVIPYCYDASLAQPPAIVEHAGPFRHLVFFGRLETRKGLHLFCRALAKTPALRDHADQVTFLGKPSSVEGRPSEDFIASEMSAVPEISWRIKSDLGSFEAQAWLASQKDVLVVAPSLVDNLPYAVIELQTRRIPFVATNIGGIPEIVGAANPHMLAEPTEASLGATIARICRAGKLVVDYRSGFDVTASNTAHVGFVRDMLSVPLSGPTAAGAQSFDIVITNAADEDVASIGARAGAADGRMLSARWIRFEEWRRTESQTPALFLDARVRPDAGCASRLLNALRQPGVDAATSYFVREDGEGARRDVAPLGLSLECGWRVNAFGGPCFAANPSAFPKIASSGINGRFAFWPAYAAMACANHSLAMVPAPLYTVAADALPPPEHAELEAVLHEFHAHAPAHLDLGWLLKSVFAGPSDVSSLGVNTGNLAATASAKPAMGRALYDRFVSTPDDLIGAYAGLIPAAADDPFVCDFNQLRERLRALVARCRQTDARVFVYGAGAHARMMFTVCPELGAFVAGFIDRRPLSRFMGKPCLTPDAFRNEMADVIVYSSREYERDMFAAMRHASVEHVLLYGESPQTPEVTTTIRLRNRFGHQGADLAALSAMYQPPAWATGYVSGADAAFLQEMIAAHAPRTIVEIGVASGASSAAILHALDRLPDPEQRILISCDVRPTCYFNEAYRTGQACGEMYPSPRARWRREFEMDARRLMQSLPEASVDLTFIDANHSHPWPLLDLLHVTAIAKPGSWIVLHDVDLPLQYPQYQVYGPRWLFQAWPFNKVKGVGQWTSIAAVQMPDAPSLLEPMARALLARPWEQAPTPWHVGLPPAFDRIQAELEARLAPADADLVTN
jgi:glycosyltransferase involved in cell wall biosynthesis/predicted O-methyltransferase YrrM